MTYHAAVAAKTWQDGGATDEGAMIFADLEYPGSYDDAHDSLVRLLRLHFTRVEAGHQGDSWIWVEDGALRVTIDTFSAMTHQVKSDGPGEHVQRVLEVLRAHYHLRLKQPPEPEGHE